MSEKIQSIDVDAIDESPTQPRTKWGDMEELSAAIKARGHALDPVLVRVSPTHPERYELVDGARRTRASKMAGLPFIAAIVREYESQAQLELDQVLSSHREPLTALDEGTAYARLESAHGWTVAEIAARSGASAATVAHRIRLTLLIPSIRALVDADRIGLIGAQLIATQPEDVQEVIADDLARLYPTSTRITNPEIEIVVARHVRRIDGASFDPEDVALTGVACGSCRSNTRSQRDLFAEVGGRCTNLIGWAAKNDAHEAKLRGVAEARGARWLSPDEAAVILDGARVRPSARWVDVDLSIDVSDPMTWRELERELAASSVDGQGFDQSKVAFARVGDAFVELCEGPYVAEFIVARYPEAARRLRGERDPAVVESAEAKAKKKAKALVDLQVRNRAMVAVVEKLSLDETRVLHPLLLLALDVAGSATCGEVARRRALTSGGEHERDISPKERIARVAIDMDGDALGKLLIEVLATRVLADEAMPWKVADELLGLAGVDRKKLAKEIEREGRNVRTKKPRKSLPVVVDAPEVAS